MARTARSYEKLRSRYVIPVVKLHVIQLTDEEYDRLADAVHHYRSVVEEGPEEDRESFLRVADLVDDARDNGLRLRLIAAERFARVYPGRPYELA